MRLSHFARVANTLTRARPSVSQRTVPANHHTPSKNIQPPTQRSSSAAASQTTSPMWPIGTWDDPLPIVSNAHQRVVACTGPSAHSGAVQPHDTVWITVEKDKLCQCPSCRQVFKLELRQS